MKKKISCPLCGEKVTRGYLAAHKAQMHSSTRLQKPVEKHSVDEKRRRTKRDGKELVSCKICGAKVKRRNLMKHRKAKHPTVAERMRKIFGPDEEAIAEAKIRRLTVSGGAPGLGKRK